MSKPKPINAAQNALYWREWGYVTKACKKHNFRLPDRHELHIKALGADKSHAAFTNKDLDKVLAEFRALSQPTSVTGQVRQIRQPATRILHLIKFEYRATLAVLLPIKYGKVTLTEVRKGEGKNECPNFYLADTYLKSVLTNRFKTDDVKDLNQEPKPTGTGDPKSELEMYRDTIARCISQARQQLGLTVHEMNVMVGLDCECKACKSGTVETGTTVMQPHHQPMITSPEPEPVTVESTPF